MLFRQKLKNRSSTFYRPPMLSHTPSLIVVTTPNTAAMRGVSTYSHLRRSGDGIINGIGGNKKCRLDVRTGRKDAHLSFWTSGRVPISSSIPSITQSSFLWKDSGWMAAMRRGLLSPVGQLVMPQSHERKHGAC